MKVFNSSDSSTKARERSGQAYNAHANKNSNKKKKKGRRKGRKKRRKEEKKRKNKRKLCGNNTTTDAEEFEPVITHCAIN